MERDTRAERAYDEPALAAVPRDRAAVDVALDELDRQIAGLQEGVESMLSRLGPVLIDSSAQPTREWAQLEVNRGASPLAQGIMDRADTLGRLTAHMRDAYDRIDL